MTDPGLRTRAHVVVRDQAGDIRAWGSVHDRAVGRMVYGHVVDPALDDDLADKCSEVLLTWAVGQAHEVGTARGVAIQQVDTGAFADDRRQHRWLADGRFDRVRTWWQMSRPVVEADASLVPDPAHWTRDGVTFRLVTPGPGRAAARGRPPGRARRARGCVRRPLQLA